MSGSRREVDLAEHEGRIFLVGAVQKWNGLAQQATRPQPGQGPGDGPSGECPRALRDVGPAHPGSPTVCQALFTWTK